MIVSGAVTAGDITINAEKNTVSSTVMATSVTLTAAADDDGAVDAAGDYLAGEFTGFYIATPEAIIDLTGATITATGDVTLTATATTDISVTPSDLGGALDLGLVTILPIAKVTLDNTTLSAANLTADATVIAIVAFTDAADASDNSTTADAAVTVLVLTGDATMAVQGASTLSVSGDVALNATTTLDVNSTADGSGGTAGATLAVTEVQVGTAAFVRDSASIGANAGNTPDSVTIGATLNSTVATVATSTAGGAESGGGSNQSEQTLADPAGDGNGPGNTDDAAGTSEGLVSFAGAVVVSDYNPTTEVYINTSGSVETAGTLSLAANATDSVTASADGSATGGGAGAGVAVAINVADVITRAYLGSSGSLTASAINVDATLAAGATYSATATSGAGDGADVGIAGSLAINTVDTSVSAAVKSGAGINLNGGSLTLTANSTTAAVASATPDDPGLTPADLGIGASVAINVASNTTFAGLEDGAVLTNTNDLTLTATGNHSATTTAESLTNSRRRKRGSIAAPATCSRKATPWFRRSPSSNPRSRFPFTAETNWQRRRSMFPNRFAGPNRGKSPPRFLRQVTMSPR